MKKWYLSKTLWVNGLTVLVSGITAVSAVSFVNSSPWIFAGATAALGALNIALRFVTTSPIAATFLHNDILTHLDFPESNRHYHLVEVRK